MKENKKMKKVAIATVTTLVSLSSTVMVNALDADNDIAQQSIQEESVQGIAKQDTKQGWSIEDGKKYYYNEWGLRVGGLVTIDGITYYFGGQGCSISEFEGDYTMNGQSDHKLFTYNNKGIVEESIEIVPNEIIEFKGSRYCFDSYYRPYNGVREVNGKKYYFFSNGTIYSNKSMLNNINIIKQENYLYAYDYDGNVIDEKKIISNQWIDFQGNKYYFDEYLNPYVGDQVIKGVEYFFNSDGSLSDDGTKESRGSLFYTENGVVIEKTTIKDGEPFEFRGQIYLYERQGTSSYYMGLTGIHEFNGKEYYFYNGKNKTTENQLETTYNNQYVFVYNSKGEVIEKEKIVENQLILVKSTNKKYMFDKNHYAIDGIKKIDGIDYYFEDGALMTNSQAGRYYSINYGNNGEGDYYYVVVYNEKAEVLNIKYVENAGWFEIEDKKYYFVNIDAWAYTGVHTIDGERYYFNENGQLAVNKEDKEYISISFVDGYGIDRYLVSYDKDGKVKETKLIKPNQWIEFAGGKYYFNKNYDAYSGWQEIDGKMYFFDENSKVHTGWLEVDGKKYYLNQDGTMVTGTQKIDGKQYTFNEKGEMYDSNKSTDNKNTTEQIKTETISKSNDKKDKSSKVKTGDETVIGVWSLLIFISGLFGIRSFKRKKEI